MSNKISKENILLMLRKQGKTISTMANIDRLIAMSNTVQCTEQYARLILTSISESKHFEKHCEIHPMTQLKLLVGAYDKGGVKGKLQRMQESAINRQRYWLMEMQRTNAAEFQRQVLNQYMHKQ